MARTISERMRPLVESGRTVIGEVLHTDPRQLFFYVRLPASVRERLTQVGRDLLQGTSYEPEINDHITLLWLPKLEAEIPQERVERVRADLRDLAMDTPVMRAKVNSWAYFDGAIKDKQPQTALVLLVNAVGLPDLHVDIKRMMARHDFETKQTHGYTPHATVVYLPPSTRMERQLPVIDFEFQIEEIEVSCREYYPVPLGVR